MEKSKQTSGQPNKTQNQTNKETSQYCPLLRHPKTHSKPKNVGDPLKCNLSS